MYFAVLPTPENFHPSKKCGCLRASVSSAEQSFSRGVYCNSIIVLWKSPMTSLVGLSTHRFFARSLTNRYYQWSYSQFYVKNSQIWQRNID